MLQREMVRIKKRIRQIPTFKGLKILAKKFTTFLKNQKNTPLSSLENLNIKISKKLKTTIVNKVMIIKKLKDFNIVNLFSM
tara:strand:+ start:465 stop:707 length:243 start_codon:yes stop_codon:yes gene_type:complete